MVLPILHFQLQKAYNIRSGNRRTWGDFQGRGTEEPNRFKLDPTHHFPGLNN